MQDCTPETHDQQPQIDGITPYFPPDPENYAPWVAKHGLLAPYGECQCKCGEMATITKHSDMKIGARKHHPYRYVHGHHKRVAVQIAKPALCACGCGGATRPYTQSSTKQGITRGQPAIFIHGHHARLQVARPSEDRFWSKVDKRGPDDCWLWTAGIGNGGYGAMSVPGDRRRKVVSATRFSYELHYGPIPEGLLVCHNCDSRYAVGDITYRRCVNPAHLWLGSYSENNRDAYDKGRKKGPPDGHGLIGEEHPRALFTNEQVLAWRVDFPNSGMTKADFARLHGVRSGTMVSILNRVSYKHLP